MPFTYPTSFMDVWVELVDTIKAQTIFTGGEAIQAAYSYFNTDPELRNPLDESRYPGIVLTTIAPRESPDWIVQEKVKCIVNVTAAAPYLEGVKVPTLALADGQTLELTRGFLNGSVQDEETLTITFLAGSFVDISQATPAEIAAVIDAVAGIGSSVPTGNTVRITHDDTGSAAYLQIAGGTAAALIATFPSYEVVGRDAGEEQQARRPVTHYDFPFQLATLADRFDDHQTLKKFVEALFRETLSPRERGTSISGGAFEVTPGTPVDDPLVEEGAFVTTYPFALRRIPISWDGDSFNGDNFNGGNFDGSGENPLGQTPVVVTFEFNLDPKDMAESL